MKRLNSLVLWLVLFAVVAIPPQLTAENPVRKKFVYSRKDGIHGQITLQERGIWRETASDGYDQKWRHCFSTPDYIELEFVKNPRLKYRIWKNKLEYKGNMQDDFSPSGTGRWVE